MSKRSKSEPFLMNKTDSAAFFQISVQAISNWDVQPVKKVGNQVFYDLRDLVNYKNETGDEEEELNLSRERAKLIVEQTKKTKLERLQLEGKLMEVDYVVLNYSKMAIAIRAKLLSLPTKIAPDMVGLKKPAEAQKIIKEHIHEVLTEISDDQFSADIGIDVERTLAKLEAMQATN